MTPIFHDYIYAIIQCNADECVSPAAQCSTVGEVYGINTHWGNSFQRTRMFWRNKPTDSSMRHTVCRLVLDFRVYCLPNYYNTQCSKKCIAGNGPIEHYTCDPATGDKVCRPGKSRYTYLQGNVMTSTTIMSWR